MSIPLTAACLFTFFVGPRKDCCENGYLLEESIHLLAAKSFNCESLIAGFAEEAEVRRIVRAAEGFRLNVIDFKRMGRAAIRAFILIALVDFAMFLRQILLDVRCQCDKYGIEKRSPLT